MWGRHNVSFNPAWRVSIAKLVESGWTLKPILAISLNLGCEIDYVIDLSPEVPGNDVINAMHCLASLKILAWRWCHRCSLHLLSFFQRMPKLESLHLVYRSYLSGSSVRSSSCCCLHRRQDTCSCSSCLKIRFAEMKITRTQKIEPHDCNFCLRPSAKDQGIT